MKKNKNSGYILAETIVVTMFVAGVLIFLFVQFSNVSSNYNDSYSYNTVEGIYSLRNIKKYILSDVDALNLIENNIEEYGFVDITDCSIFTNQSYCLKLFELENIDILIVTDNYFNSDLIDEYDQGFIKFINKIRGTDKEKYRIITAFNNSTYATIRFGEQYE